MTFLSIAGYLLELDLANEAAQTLRPFVTRIGSTERGRGTHILRVYGDRRPRLAVDGETCRADLELPRISAVPGGLVTVEIAVLQAAARSLAAMASGGVALLHGGAVSMDGGDSAVAVLDGGRGQGKTSLAMGLAQRGGQLLVDEFTFATFDGPQVGIVALPSLPWHLRADMAPVLAPGTTSRLLHRDELAGLGYGGTDRTILPLGLIVVPDHSLPPGKVERLPVEESRRLLRAAVTDHGAKFRDPALDHVSIFTERTQMEIRSRADAARDERVLDMLDAIPAFRAGIGLPADLPQTVDAVIGLGLGV